VYRKEHVCRDTRKSKNYLGQAFSHKKGAIKKPLSGQSGSP
jgi:hypothetical protein